MGPLIDVDDDVERIGGLAASLNRIVRDPLQVSALHELLGPFCHQSRNLLNCLKMSLYLAQRVEARTSDLAWGDVEQNYRNVENFYERLQMICRPITIESVRLSLGLLLEDRRRAWVDRFAARGVTLELIAPRKPDGGDYDPNCLGRALDAFVGWRAEVLKEGCSARFCWSVRSGTFHLEWAESGPGSRKCVSESVSTRRETAGFHRLALPLIARVVSAHGGNLEFVELSGGHLRLSWPQFVTPPH